MPRVQGAARQFVLPFVRQVTLSVTATLVATIIFKTVQSGVFAFHPFAVDAPAMTSGGKFAARVEAMADEPDRDVVAMLPAIVAPVLPTTEAARSVPKPDLQAEVAGIMLPALRIADTPAVETPKATHHAARAQTKPHRATDVAQAVVPPRRADFIVDSAPLPVAAVGEGTLETSVSTAAWATTKALFKDAAALGGAMWDRVIP